MNSSSDALEPVELLADEFMERQRRGERPTIDEYVRRHPDLADEIREVFPALAVIEQIAPASADLEQSQTSVESPARIRVSQIGDYRILREIGRGGMGVVYEAEQQSLRRRVALKVLPRQVTADRKALKRFQQEARAAARMHHTNIVPVFEVGQDDEHVYYAMQLIQGQGLDLVIEDLQRLRTEHSGVPASKSAAAVALADRSEGQGIAASLVMGEFEKQDLIAEARQAEGRSHRTAGDMGSDEHGATVIAETALFGGGSTASAVLPGKSEISTAETDRGGYFRSVARIGHQTASALSYAHARGIIHRDIKPSNLLLDTAGVVWVTDFGLAKTGDEALTHTGDILGTIRYMSPERFRGQCDVRADVYSLGLTLYELLVLKPAYSSPDRLKLIEMVTKSEPPTPRSVDPRIPRDLETIVLKSIDKDPRRRYQSADELCEDLERFIQDEPIKARRVSAAERLVRWSRRNRGLATSLATVCVLLLIINIAGPLLYWRQTQQTEQLAKQKEQLDKNFQELQELREQEKTLSEGQLAAAKEKERAIAKLLTSEQEKQEEQKQKLIALDKLEETVVSQKRDIYAGDMQQVASEAQRGNLARMRELLFAYIPDTRDDTDLRGPEWYYWWHFLNQSEETGKLEVTGAETTPQVVILPGGGSVAVARGETIQIFQRRADGFHLSEQPSYTVPTNLPANTVDRNPMTASGLVVENVNATRPRFWIKETPGRRVADYVPPGESFHVFGSDGKSQEFKFPPGDLQHLSALALSPDGRLVAALGVSSERDEVPVVCRLLVWSVDTSELRVNQPHKGELNRITFNHDGSLIAAYLAHGTQRRLDVEREVVVVFELIENGTHMEATQLAVASHNDDIDSVYFFPNRREMLLGTLGWSNHLVKELYDWSIDDTPLRRLGEETLPDYAQGEISRDGLFAVSGKDISTVRLIDTRTGKTTRTLYNSEGCKIGSLTFSPAGDRLIACGATQKSARVLEWDVHSPDLFAMQSIPVTLPDNPYSNFPAKPVYAVSPDQSLLAYTDKNGLMLREREGMEWTLSAPLRPNTYSTALRFSPDSQWLAFYDVTFLSAERRTVQEVSLYKRDNQSGMKLTNAPITLPGPTAGNPFTSLTEMAFTSDGKLLVKRYGRIHLIDLPSKQVTELAVPNNLSQLEAEKRALLLSAPVTIRRTGQTVVATLEPAGESAIEDDSQLSVQSSLGIPGRWALHLLDVVSGTSIARQDMVFDGDIADDVQGVVVAPDGQHVGLLWKKNRRIEIRDLQHGGSVWELYGDGLVFSPDASLLAVYSTERNSASNRLHNVTLCDVAQRTELSTISLVGTGADEIRFSPDSLRLLTLHGLQPSSSADVAAEVRIWDVRSAHELLSFPVETTNHYFWDIAVDPAGDQFTTVTTLVFAKYTTGRDSSVAKAYDLSRISQAEETRLVAEPLVKTLFEESLLKREVQQRLELNDQLLDGVRAAAMDLVQKRGNDDLNAISDDCLAQIIQHLSQPDARRYQHWGEAFERCYPDDPRSRLIRGIAQYYNGETEDLALTLLAPEDNEGGPSGRTLLPGQNLVRHAFRTLAWLRAENRSRAEMEMLQMCRALRRDFGVNYFAADNVDVPTIRFSTADLFTHVRGELDNHHLSVLGNESTPQQAAEKMMLVLDQNSDDVLTEVDCAQDWEQMSRLDRDADGMVSADELTVVMSAAAEGLNYPDERVVSATRSLQSTPMSSRFWRSRAGLWRSLGEYARALADCEEDLRLNPTETYTLNLRGLVHLDVGDNVSAMADFEEINSHDPDYAPAWNNRGLCLERQGKDRESIEYYSRAISLGANTINVNNRARVYLGLGDLDNALKDFDELIRLEPGSASLYEQRGHVRLALKDYDAAIEDFEKAGELDPRQNSAIANVVLALVLSGNAEGAVTRLVSGLEHEPDAGKRIQLIEQISSLGLDLTDVVQLRPDDPVLLAALARQRSGRGDPQAGKALESARRLAEEQFAKAPDDKNAASVVSTVLLASIEPATDWTVLKPAEVTSAGGATLTKLDDGSILATGILPAQEVYTVIVRPPHKEITCVVLETLPDPTLPFGRSGRHPLRGNFLISEVGLSIRDDATRPEAHDVSLIGVASDSSGRADAPTSQIENMLPGHANHWTAWPDVDKPHRVVFEPAEPLRIPENGALQITINCSDPKYPQNALGRFRLSVSNSPTAFEDEQLRLAALKIGDAWEQLAAVYQLLGKEQERDALIARRPEATLGVARIYMTMGESDNAVEWVDRAAATMPDTPVLLQQLGEWNVRLERWREAARDYEKVLNLKTDVNSAEWMPAVALYAMAVTDGSGTIDDYGRICGAMVKKYHSSREAMDIERTMKCCSILAPQTNIGLLQMERVTGSLADGTASAGLVPWFHVASALADYRRGEFETAEESAARADETAASMQPTTRDTVRAVAGGIRALAQAAMGRRDEARATLDAAREHLLRIVQRRPDGTIVGTSLFYENGAFDHDRLIAHMLIREAEAALDQ